MQEVGQCMEQLPSCREPAAGRSLLRISALATLVRPAHRRLGGASLCVLSCRDEKGRRPPGRTPANISSPVRCRRSLLTSCLSRHLYVLVHRPTSRGTPYVSAIAPALPYLGTSCTSPVHRRRRISVGSLRCGEPPFSPRSRQAAASSRCSPSIWVIHAATDRPIVSG
jgi:hypothetical protein